MYTITEHTELPPDFDSLVEQSIPAMDAGTFDWSFVGSPVNVDGKKSSLREAFEVYLGAPFGRVVSWQKDGTLVQVNAGLVTPEDPQYIQYTLNVCGDDANGTKAWIHDPAYITASREYMRDAMSLLGYKIVCYKDQSLYNYHSNKVGAETNYVVAVDSEHTDPSNRASVVTLKFTYI
jgi:hypothetical protein